MVAMMRAVPFGLALAATVTVLAVGAPAAVASTAAALTSTCTIVNGTADAWCTPGAYNPDVTQSTIYSTICVSGWTATVRPPSSYTTALKNQQKAEYGESGIPNSELEEDHLVPLELGGAPRDPNNLWPEPRASAGTAGSGDAAEDKDREENSLKRQVCAGTITLRQARQQILTDWTH
jgi:hypothetical protein